MTFIVNLFTDSDTSGHMVRNFRGHILLHVFQTTTHNMHIVHHNIGQFFQNVISDIRFMST